MKKIFSLWLCMTLVFCLKTAVYANETDPSLQEGDRLQISEDQQQDGTSQQTEPHEHNWAYVDELDGINHKMICAACQTEETQPHAWDGGVVTIEANCMQEGVRTYTCSGCQAHKTESIPQMQTHRFGDWIKNATGHSRSCQDCLVEESETHEILEEIIKIPTCREDGSKKKSCAVCGYSETVILMKLSVHTYDSACDSQCNVCGLERITEHEPIKVWSSDSKGHWYDCQKCDEKLNFSKHIAGPEATEEKAQVCLTCNYIIMPQKEHKHSYGNEWTNDDVGHWHACAKCAQEKNYEAHVFENTCDSECNICGYTRENSHIYDIEGWMTSKFEHWSVCTVCGEESKHEKHIPGEEATDELAQLCTVCGFELTPMLEHTHAFEAEWLRNEESHWKKCECGELSVPVSHVWNEGVENSNGTYTYTCVDCGAEKIGEKQNTGFPWLIIILVILALGCLGGIAVLVIMLKRGDENEEPDDELFLNDVEEDSEAEPEDQEEKMIDAYFASLEKDK